MRRILTDLLFHPEERPPPFVFVPLRGLEHRKKESYFRKRLPIFSGHLKARVNEI